MLVYVTGTVNQALLLRTHGKAEDILVVSKTVRLSCVKTSSTNENAVATAADMERATQIEFGSVPDDSTGGAVRISDSATMERTPPGPSKRARVAMKWIKRMTGLLTAES